MRQVSAARSSLFGHATGATKLSLAPTPKVTSNLLPTPTVVVDADPSSTAARDDVATTSLPTIHTPTTPSYCFKYTNDVDANNNGIHHANLQDTVDCWELIHVYLQALLDWCKGKFSVLQVDAMNLPGIINRGSPKLPLNVFARELF